MESCILWATVETSHLLILVNLQRTQSKSAISQAVPPPGQLQFQSVTPDSVTVSWSPPEDALGHHKYRVTRRGDQEQRRIKVAGLTLTVTDLIPGETYHFSVTTLSEDGSQSTCVEGSVITEVPPPENLSMDLKLFTATVSWTKPAMVDQVSYLLELLRHEECIDTIHRDSLHHTFTDLLPGQSYIMNVSTVLKNGKHQSKPVSRPFKIVNGQSTMKLSLSDAVQLIKQAGKRLTLTVVL